MAAWRAHCARRAAPRSCAETHPGRAGPSGTAGSNPGESWLRRMPGIRPRRRVRNGYSRLEARRHDGPGLAARLDVAFGGQQGIGGFDGASGQAQFLGQRACRGNAVARLQHAAGDGAAKPIVDLPVERFGRRRIQRRELSGFRGRHGPIRSFDERKTHYAITVRIGLHSSHAAAVEPARGKSWTSRKAHSWTLDAGRNCSYR